jgi:hypothetical protein
LARSDEIGTSIGTGLSRIRHRLEDCIDNKSKPKSDMPKWWISSTWVPPDDDDDDDDNDKNDENGGDNDKNDKDDNNDVNDNNDNNSTPTVQSG